MGRCVLLVSSVVGAMLDCRRNLSTMPARSVKAFHRFVGCFGGFNLCRGLGLGLREEGWLRSSSNFFDFQVSHVGLLAVYKCSKASSPVRSCNIL